MAKLPPSSKAALLAMLNGYSLYTMRGADKLIVRKKGGPKKSAIRNSPRYHMLRLNQSEFRIRSRAVHYVRMAMVYQRVLADYNFAGALNALMRKVQVLDKVNDLGERGVFLSGNKELLKGFSLNKTYMFDAVIRYPITAVIKREELSASVHIPAIIPGINFFTQAIQPYCRFRVMLGIIPDVSWSKDGPVVQEPFSINHKMRDTNWFPTKKGSPEMNIEIKLDSLPLKDDFTLILTIGLCYGVVQDQDTIVQASRVGCAKVLEVG